MHRTDIKVPVIIVAYNNYMNLVNRMYHICSSNSTRRRENQLQMSMFTYIMDLAYINENAVFEEITSAKTHENVPFNELKQIICEKFTILWRNKSSKGTSLEAKELLFKNNHSHVYEDVSYNDVEVSDSSSEEEFNENSSNNSDTDLKMEDSKSNNT